MSETNTGVEAIVRRLRREAEKTLEKLPDARLKVKVLAGMAMLYADKVLESIPRLQFADATEAQDLKAEVQLLRRRAVDAIHEIDEGGAPGVRGLEPSMN